MNEIFDYAFAYLLGDEGRTYTNRPNDPGGPTKFGVTLKAYKAYKEMPGGPLIEAFDIEMLTEDQAKQFYFERYWLPLKCDKMKFGSVAICLFDSGVLYGVGTVARMAQLAVSRCGATIKFDGILGDNTLAVINLVRAADFLAAFHDLILERIDHVIKINPEEEEDRAGWTHRADRLLALNGNPILNEPRGNS